MPMGCQNPERLWLTDPLTRQGGGLLHLLTMFIDDENHCHTHIVFQWPLKASDQTQGQLGPLCITCSWVSRWFSCHYFLKLVVNLSTSLIGEAHRSASPLHGWQPAIGGAGKTRPKSCNCQKNWTPRHLWAGISWKRLRGRTIQEDF